MRNLYIIFLFITIPISSQTFENLVIEPLKQNNLLFEKVYIHTNKTSYLNGDLIWFKAYVSDSKNYPSKKTTRLYVNLLDEEGLVIQNKNILIYDGIGLGQFQLSVGKGIFYIQAYTNYMRNFGESNYFITKISVSTKYKKKSQITKTQYDFQIFPEGGYLLEEVDNNIGMKLLINGKGVKYSGSIINSKNKIIKRFESEYLGMTKSHFFYKEGEEYIVQLSVNDTIIKKNIPNARDKGVIISLNKINSDFIDITIKTNKKSLNYLNTNTYNLLFHQRNKLSNYLEIEIDSLNKKLKLNTSFFFNGVNTFTLFKNNNPVLERKFYIEKTNRNSSLTLKKRGIENDSIEYQLKITPSKKFNISISTLSSNSKSYIEKTNIKAAFLLSPYIKGYIENPAYYFNNKNKNQIKHIDLLLLTQGWTQYSRQKMIETLNPDYKFNFELGFKLKGTISPLFSNQLALITKENLLIDKLFLNGNQKFNFKKLLIYKGDTVRLAFLDNKNIAKQPKNIYFDSVKVKNQPKFIYAITDINLYNKPFNEISDWKGINGAEQLKEVNVFLKRKNTNYYEKKKLVEKYRNLVFDIGKYYKVELPKKYEYGLMFFLESSEKVSLQNWKGMENYLSYGVNKEAILFIDGKRISSDELTSISIQMEDVENIMMQPIRGNISIQVFTTTNYKKGIMNLFKEYVFKEGYDKTKEYYAPEFYYDTPNQMEIDWKPNLKTNDVGEIFFKVKRHDNIKDYVFSIQGFSEKGILISNFLDCKN